MLAGCETDLSRRITGRQETVGESFARERPLLRGLPAERPSTADEVTPRVDSKSLVTIKQNRYSVPVRLAGLRIHARVGAREIECRHSGELVAVHERQQGRFGISASLDHYLELLARKPGALAGSLALSQERERGTWPSAFDELWGKITERYGSSEAAPQRWTSMRRSSSLDDVWATKPDIAPIQAVGERPGGRSARRREAAQTSFPPCVPRVAKD